jgi:hypothetical protein
MFGIFLWSLLCVGLCFAGTVFVLLSGAWVGLSSGIGAEQTGGAVYVLIGLGLDVVVGAAISGVIHWRFASRSMARMVFYSFTAPAFVAVALMGLRFLAL